MHSISTLIRCIVGANMIAILCLVAVLLIAPQLPILFKELDKMHEVISTPPESYLIPVDIPVSKYDDSTFLNLIELEIPFVDPRVILAQMLHETDFWRSRIFREGKNTAGMKPASHAGDRGGTTTALRDSMGNYILVAGHASYSTIGHSVKDLGDWIKVTNLKVPRAKRPTRTLRNKKKVVYYTIESYIKLVEDFHYAEDRAYGDKLRNMFKIVRNEGPLKMSPDLEGEHLSGLSK